MTDIRKYIDLVEQSLKEWPFSKKPDIDINKRIFGRKEPTTSLPQPPKTHNDYAKSGERVDNKFGKNGSSSQSNRIDPAYGGVSKDLETAREYKSAEVYAYSPNINQYMPINTYDPPQVKQRAKSEAERLMNKWNLWKKQGYI
jgi:hypothetical protein